VDDLIGREYEQAEHRMAGDFRGSTHADMTGAERVLEPVVCPLDDRADAVSDGSGIGMAGGALGSRGSGLA